MTFNLIENFLLEDFQFSKLRKDGRLGTGSAPPNCISRAAASGMKLLLDRKRDLLERTAEKLGELMPWAWFYVELTNKFDEFSDLNYAFS